MDAAEIEANKAATFTRRIAQRFDNVKWPRLLVLKDKHENEYFLITDIDALWRASLQIVEARLIQLYFYEPKREKLIEEVPDDVIDKLPEAMKKKAISDKGSNKFAEKRYQRELEQWQNIQKALADKNGALAYKILDDRKDHEYEGFAFERLKVP